MWTKTLARKGACISTFKVKVKSQNAAPLSHRPIRLSFIKHPIAAFPDETQAMTPDVLSAALSDIKRGERVCCERNMMPWHSRKSTPTRLTRPHVVESSPKVVTHTGLVYSIQTKQKTKRKARRVKQVSRKSLQDPLVPADAERRSTLRWPYRPPAVSVSGRATLTVDLSVASGCLDPHRRQKDTTTTTRTTTTTSRSSAQHEWQRAQPTLKECKTNRDSVSFEA